MSGNCPSCGGSGQLRTAVCNACGGSGCRDCNFNGRLFEPCYRCGGTGRK